MAGVGWGATTGRAVPLGPLALALALLIGPAGLGITPRSGDTEDAPSALSVSSSPPAPHLAVEPAARWVAGGVATNFTAIWTEGLGPCSLTPVWYSWYLPTGTAGGTLGAANNSTVEFVGTSALSGPAEVAVRAAATLACPNGTSTSFANASADVLVLAPLELTNLTLGPAPLPAGATATLTATVAGGIPPYRASVAWGDGNRSTENLSGSGTVTLNHQFPNGTFAQNVTVVDSAGAEESLSVPEPLEVGLRVEGAILASTPVAEVGVPVVFHATILGFPGSYLSNLSACDSNSRSNPGPPPAIRCDPTLPGTLGVFLQAEDGGLWPVVRQYLGEPVNPAVALSLDPGRASGEVGVPYAFSVNVSGGVPPFTLSWTLAGAAQSAPAPLAEDGSVQLWSVPELPGFEPVTISVVDGEGARASEPNGTLFVVPPLNVSLEANSTVAAAAAEIGVAGSIVGGLPPYSWVVLASLPFAANEPSAGWTSGPGGIEWSASLADEGSVSIEVATLDSAGALNLQNLTVGLVPLLTGTFALSVENGSPPRVAIALELAGGLPPFEITVGSSKGPGWNGTDPADGPFSVTIPWNGSGPAVLSVSVMDSLGGRFSSNASVSIPLVQVPPPPVAPASPPPDGSVAWWPAAVLAGVGAVVALALFLRRRTRNEPTPPSPSPEAVLERIIAPCDGAERVTVELLAEEQGVPLDLVRSTLTRLIAERRVRSEVSPDGEEVLAWADSTGA